MTLIILFLALHSISWNLEIVLSPKTHRLLFKYKLCQQLLFYSCFIVFLIITQRLFTSLLATLTVYTILVIANNNKFNLLKEPLVLADFALCSEVIHFPNLYFPFINPYILFIPLGLLLFFISIFYFEPAFHVSSHYFLELMAYGSFLSLTFYTLKYIAKPLKLSLEPEVDVKKYGLVNSLFFYFFATANTKEMPIELNQRLIVDTNLKVKPHIIAIQSESFFDVRSILPQINPAVLQNYDKIRQESLHFGELITPAWGAFTVRSEFSFLTGIANEELSFGRFHPFHHYRGQTINTIAWQLKKQGYRCICIHPFAKEFYGRDKIYPGLGFDAFYDIQSFKSEKYCGNYISDDSVCEKIISELDNSQQPLFIFAITMENHGPYHLEKLPEDLMQEYFTSTYSPTLQPLGSYLHHLNNADKMLAKLTDYLKNNYEQSMLIWYGDHVAELSKVHHVTNFNAQNTNYLIWTPQPNVPQVKELPVDQLMHQVLSLICK